MSRDSTVTAFAEADSGFLLESNIGWTRCYTLLGVFIDQLSSVENLSAKKTNKQINKPRKKTTLNTELCRKLGEGESENLIYERLAWGLNYHAENLITFKFQNSETENSHANVYKIHSKLSC